jgi:hypothetical protein
LRQKGNQHKVKQPKQFVAIALISLAVLECRDSDTGQLSGKQDPDEGNLYGEPTPVLGVGAIGSAQAAGNESREISLVSLIFQYAEEIGSLSGVVDRITGNAVPFSFEIWDSKAVVTLQLQRDVLANPRLTSEGGASFTALLLPEQGLSTFDGLEFRGPTVFLRDYGKEIELKEGIPTEIAPGDLTSLWNGERMVMAARARFSPAKTGSYDPVLEPNTTVTVKQNDTLLTWKEPLKLGARESASLAVTPPPDAGTITLSVVAH